jgi:hypothetical protein
MAESFTLEGQEGEMQTNWSSSADYCELRSRMTPDHAESPRGIKVLKRVFRCRSCSSSQLSSLLLLKSNT